MAIGPIFSYSLIDDWANLMINSLWQGSLLCFLTWGIIRLFPKIHPSIQCWLWRLIYVKLIIAFFWLKPVKLYFQLQTSSHQLRWLLVNSDNTRHFAKMTRSIFKTVLPVPTSFLEIKFWFVLWFIGAVFFMGGLFYLFRRQQILRNSCSPLQDDSIISCYQALGRQNKFRKIPELFTAERIHSPLLQGIIQPKIILPASMLNDFKTDELRLVLAHELAHYKRGDLCWNWLPVIARSLFFFFPVVWWIEKKLVQLQEICSDQLAVKYTKAPANYFGNMLLRVSIQPEPTKSNPLTAYYYSKSVTLLKKRLEALRSINQTKRNQVVITGFILLLLGIAAVIPWQLVEETLPVNLWINYFTPHEFEISAHVIEAEGRILKTTLLIDDNPLPDAYNVNKVYFGYNKRNRDDFPQMGLHKVTVKTLTTTRTIINHHWIYFQDSMNWSNWCSGIENDKTVIKIGPFFWILNNNGDSNNIFTHIF